MDIRFSRRDVLCIGFGALALGTYGILGAAAKAETKAKKQSKDGRSIGH